MFKRFVIGVFSLLVILVTIDCSYGYEPSDSYRSKPNIFGGKNYYSKSGRYLGNSKSNVFGGKNYFNSSNKMYSQTNSKGSRLK